MCVALCFQGDGSATELPADQRTADKGHFTAAQEGEELNIHIQETSPPMLCTILGSHNYYDFYVAKYFTLHPTGQGTGSGDASKQFRGSGQV